ncbi:patatin family protein [uncultured Limosilactobacillus sp.]|uniref:patatin-like phospholipase family protein n=1 Tax=uncultured Limosilactobacillus sp. TaxID=2837629 RepID=UPI0025F0F4C3|nr:patatin family protein [uncultured Limosilactobacillus sp.]
MLYNAALVLEGGAMRGQYSAGVTDAFLKHHLEFKTVIGVSAGALCGANFVSKQYGRMVHVNTHYRHDPNYISSLNIIKKQPVVNLDFLFDDHGWDWNNFDEEAYQRSATDFTIVATSLAGKTVSFTNPLGEKLVEALKASSSMPFLFDPQPTDQALCLDGGVTDSIPFDLAQAKGFDKIVVVRTRPRDYQKKATSPLLKRLYQRHYRDYPDFITAAINRPEVYNQQVATLNKLEDKGQIYVIAPENPVKVGRLESNVKKIQALYDEGQAQAEALISEIEEYLAKN